jgi:hypothetical protein
LTVFPLQYPTIRITVLALDGWKQFITHMDQSPSIILLMASPSMTKNILNKHFFITFYQLAFLATYQENLKCVEQTSQSTCTDCSFSSAPCACFPSFHRQPLGHRLPIWPVRGTLALW